MRVSEIRAKQVRVNQGLGVYSKKKKVETNEPIWQLKLTFKDIKH